MSTSSASGAALRVWFASGTARDADGSRIVRCEHQARAIALAGGRASVSFVGDAADQLRLAAGDVVVLSRCAFSQASVKLVRRARAAGAHVLADFDDLIFCPWLAGTAGSSRSEALRGHADPERLTATRARQYDFLRLLPALDGTLVSTPALADVLSSLGLPARVVRNAMDTERRRPLRRRRRGLGRVLFMTGTATHDADFAEIAGALRGFLLAHPGCVLTLLGPVVCPPALRGLANVRSVAKLPMERLFQFVAEHDACLVPLEDTLFNDSKSALKFLECGLVSVPVLASPRREYRALVRHGETGLLCADGAAFAAELARLAEDPALLAELAENAHDEVLAAHTLQARTPTLVQAISELCAQGTARPLPVYAREGEP